MPRLNRKTSTLALALALASAVPMFGESASQDWPRWGGPNGNFRALSEGELAATWPAGGPPKLWTHELGDGYSSVVVSGGRLYTMYRSVRSESDVSDAKEAVICLDAATGKTLWETRYDHKPWSGHSRENGEGPRSTPLIDGKSEVEEIWSTRKIRLSFLTNVVQGDWVYGISGDRAATFLSAINVKTGEIGWRKRGFARANLVAVDGHVIIQEENGNIRLATVTPEDITVHSEVEMLEPMAWTSPTIVGTTMYLRDKTQIMAIDLGRQKDGKSPTATQILKQADAAIKAVDAVSYKITTKPDGAAVGRAPDAEGESFLHGWEGSFPMKFYSHFKITREDQMAEVEAGGDAESFYIIDHVTKKAYEDMDPFVLGSHLRLFLDTGMLEFVHDAPFDDELNAGVAELRGTEAINGEDCYEIHVVYSGGAGESTWFFAVEDYLPRRHIQYVTGPAGEAGMFTITVSDLVVNPPPDAKLFKLALPEGYEQIDDFAP